MVRGIPASIVGGAGFEPATSCVWNTYAKKRRRQLASFQEVIISLFNNILIIALRPISHLLEELEPVCDRIGILHNHSIIEIGTPDQLKGRYTKNEEIRLKASGKHDQIEKAMKRNKYVDKIKKQEGYLVFYTPEPLKTLYQVLHLVDKLKERIVSLEASKPSLKEIFESIYNK